MLSSPRPVEVDLTDPVAPDGVDLPVGGGHGGGGAGELHGRDLLPLVGVEAVTLARLQSGPSKLNHSSNFQSNVLMVELLPRVPTHYLSTCMTSYH